MARAPDSLIGKRIGGYKLEKLLGRGGMGDVYLARGKKGRRVALKILSPFLCHEPKAVGRFEREAKAHQRLEHPNVVTFFEVGAARGYHYIAMEVLRGGAFRRMLRTGEHPSRITRALAQVAAALAHAHAHGVIHRDVKPENVLMTRSGVAKVGDFGLARLSDATTFTTDGAMLGTAKYMSPEQARGQEATAASDVYSLGVMMYEAISGELPFDSKTQHGFLLQHAEQRPRRPRPRPGFSPALVKLSMQCLHKEPAARPAMAQVAAGLTQAIHWRPASRRIAMWAAAGVVLSAAAAVVIAPSLLDPLCQGWFGAPLFRDLRALAATAHSYFASAPGSVPSSAPATTTGSLV